jgi:transposase-like protein
METKKVECPECLKQTKLHKIRGFYLVHQICKSCKKAFKINYNHEPIRHVGANNG